jgi:hypothetical protein
LGQVRQQANRFMSVLSGVRAQDLSKFSSLHHQRQPV